MSKNELLSLPKKELMRMCKEAELPRYRGKTELTKEELVDSLLENVEFVVANETVNQNEPEIPIEATEVVVDKPVERKPWDMKDKTKYIEEAEVGALIAFYDEKGKPRTAALVNRSSARKVIKVVTEFGWEFIVPYDNVLWVRKGNRWPRGVYEILKGYNKNGKESVEK